jgi:hypothetical protein
LLAIGYFPYIAALEIRGKYRIMINLSERSHD